VYSTIPYGPGTPENTALGNLLTQVANNVLDNIVNSEGGGGNATEPAPYTHADENDAMSFVPDPFDKDVCARLAYEIKVLRAQLAWRKTDLNPLSKSYVSNLQRIKNVNDALQRLEKAHRDLCGRDYPK
jgi:hypothetical protein